MCGVHGGDVLPERTSLRQQLRRGSPVRRQARLVLRALFRQVHVQGNLPVTRPPCDLLDRLGRHGSNRVHRGAHEHTVRSERARALPPAGGVTIGEPPLDVVELSIETTCQVAGVQHRQPNPGIPRGLCQGVAHRVRVFVAGTTRRVVHVVELADTGDARLHHLRVHPAREQVIAVGIESRRDPVHLLPPGPERAAPRVAAQRPVEGVRVRVGQARQHQAGQPVRAPGRLPRPHRGDPRAVDLEQHVLPRPSGQPGPFAPEHPITPPDRPGLVPGHGNLPGSPRRSRALPGRG